MFLTLCVPPETTSNYMKKCVPLRRGHFFIWYHMVTCPNNLFLSKITITIRRYTRLYARPIRQSIFFLCFFLVSFVQFGGNCCTNFKKTEKRTVLKTLRLCIDLRDRQVAKIACSFEQMHRFLF